LPTIFAIEPVGEAAIAAFAESPPHLMRNGYNICNLVEQSDAKAGRNSPPVARRSQAGAIA